MPIIPDGVAYPGLHSSGTVVDADCESPSVRSMLHPVMEDFDAVLRAAFSAPVAPSRPAFGLLSRGASKDMNSDNHGIKREAGGYIDVPHRNSYHIAPMAGIEIHDTSTMRAISPRTTIHAHFHRAGDTATTPDGDTAQKHTSSAADAVSPQTKLAAAMQCLPYIWNVPVVSVRNVVATLACSGRIVIGAIDTTPSQGIAISLSILTAILFLFPALSTGGTLTDTAVFTCLMFSQWLLHNRLLLPINMRFQPIDRGRNTMPMSVSSRFGQLCWHFLTQPVQMTLV
jgi:hypothetical protein